EAMVSALAPGRLALTEMVGKSTWCSGETGSRRKAVAPESAMAAVSSVVATGRRMNGSLIFIASSLSRFEVAGLDAFASVLWGAREAARQAFEPEIDHRRGVEREHLAEDQAADDGDAKRAPQFGAGPRAERERH